MACIECSGSGSCDPCDGYGSGPDSYPNAGDGAECEVCSGGGICPGCYGAGETDNSSDDSNDHSNDSDGSDDSDECVGVMT